MKRAALALASSGVALALGLGAMPMAQAEPTIDELRAKVDEASKAYKEATDNLERINDEIAENEQHIEEVEAEIPDQRAKSSGAIRTLYKMNQNRHGLLDLLLSSEDFNDLITTVTYLNNVEEQATDEVDRLVELQKDLAATRLALSSQKDEAAKQQKAADKAVREAESLRDAAIALQAARASVADLQTAQKAIEQTAPVNVEPGAAASEGPSSQGAQKTEQAEQQAPLEAPEMAQSGNNQAIPRDQFVAEWAARIDAYMENTPGGPSPLTGYGATFAEAAWDYNVDPRWSPAISNTESSRGLHCFLPYNAWGWGKVSWPDWDTAIREHVAGLSAGYGYTISEWAAQKYCPPHAKEWYAATLAEMLSI